MLSFRKRPRVLHCVLSVLLACLLVAPLTQASQREPVFSLPIRFHIVTEWQIEKSGQRMSSWVTARDLETAVLPEINTIWRPAGIQFTLEKILYSPVLQHKNLNKLTKEIAQAHRDGKGRSDPKRIKALNKVVDQRHHDSVAINVYLVPYLGERSQGNTRPKKKRIYLTQWTDKTLAARQSPQPFQLVESRPFKKGSLARTLAHELGHMLGLKHPVNGSREQGLLMGGRRPGYALNAEEIAFARTRASAWPR
jgi:hypothetical protein